MKKLGFIVLLLFSRTAFAQIQPALQTINVLDSGVACSVTGACARWALPTQPTVTIQITGSCSCTLTFESTSDGQTWFSLITTNLATAATAATATTTGQFSFANTGIASVRVRATAFASGSMDLRALQGWASLARSGSGGSTPGGISGDLQYNNTGFLGGYTPGAGVVTWIQTPSSANLLAALTTSTGTGVAVFGTSPTFTSSATVNEAVGSSALTLTGATQTSSFPVINASQTWNNAATTFTAVKVNVTDTAKADGSLLLDLQRSGSSEFSVRGRAGNTATPTLVLAGDTSTGWWRNAANQWTWSGSGSDKISLIGGIFRISSDTSIGWTTGQSTASADVSLNRDVANVLGVRNSTTAHNFRVYNTFTTVTTSGEWLKNDWITTANQIRIGAVKGSVSGTARVLSIDYGAAEAAPTAAITVPITSGNIVFGGGITVPGGAAFLTTNTALTDGAAANTATLLNGPTAGNPTKWIAIIDNGTTRYIPSW